MEFALDETQTQLQQTVERFCGDRFPPDLIAQREGRPLDRGAWQEMAELGLFSLLAAVGTGGGAGAVGAGPAEMDSAEESFGVVEAVLAFEALGSALAPGPLVWNALAATLVEESSSGESVVGGFVAPDNPDGSVVLEHPDDLDSVLVLHDDRVELVDAGQLGKVVELVGTDPLTPVGRLEAVPVGEVVGDGDAAAQMRTLGMTLCAAMSVGIATRCQQVATGYAAGREQFGVPIGSFQAVKHMLADMYVRASLAQSATYAAAAVAEEGDVSAASQSAAAAKLLACEAALENAATAIQILGGMGFTWDMAPNYLLKRAWVLENSFGSADEHAGRLGESLAAAS